MADEIEELVSEDVQCMSHDIRESMIIKTNGKNMLCLTDCNQIALRLHHLTENTVHKITIDIVIAVNQNNAQLGRNQLT